MEKDEITELIDKTKMIINDFNSEIYSIITNPEIKKICGEYRKNNKQKNELGFNIFNIISDTFYRENFHSDILKSLLEIPEILTSFIELLIKQNPRLNLHIENYKNAIIEREVDFIDICIKGTKRALIIENKIYNAPDGPRQLPRYNNTLKKLDYTVDCIVYLSLDGTKTPYKDDWTKEEEIEINKKLIILGAYKETEFDLYSGWLQPCESLINNIDVLFLIRQYKKLLKFLGRNIMNKPIMDKFFNTIKDNFETVLAIDKMLNDLPKYQAIKIQEKFENNPTPFSEVKVWKEHNNTTYFNILKIGNSNFAIDIICKLEKYYVQFFDRYFESGENNPAIELMKKLEKDNQFIEIKNSGRIQRIFNFPEQENELFDFLTDFKEQLSNLVKGKTSH
jgi:hypothetical protein